MGEMSERMMIETSFTSEEVRIAAEMDRCSHGIRHPHSCDDCEEQWAREAEAQRRPGESTLDLYARLDAELDARRLAERMAVLDTFPGVDGIVDHRVKQGTEK